MASFGRRFQQGPDHKGETTYIMYHGTTMRAAQKIKRRGFIPSADGMLGPGVYVSRSFAKAACYPKRANGQERAVLTLSVRVGRVKAIDRQGHYLQKSWHQAGYDTAWVPPNCGMVKSGLQENCVWDPKRITVLSIQSNERESSDEESTDEEDDCDAYDSDEEEYETASRMSEYVSDEDYVDFIDERPTRRSSDTSIDEYDTDHVDNRYSHYRDNLYEASDDEWSYCYERNNVTTYGTVANREFSDKYSNSDKYSYSSSPHSGCCRSFCILL